MPFAALDFWAYLLNGIIILVSVVLAFVILIQRGKGGGLAGAFGGVGGSSAFGSRATGQIVQVTLYMALVWVLLIMINVRLLKPSDPVELSKQAEASAAAAGADEKPAEPTAPAPTPPPVEQGK